MTWREMSGRSRPPPRTVTVGHPRPGTVPRPGKQPAGNSPPPGTTNTTRTSSKEPGPPSGAGSSTSSTPPVPRLAAVSVCRCGRDRPRPDRAGQRPAPGPYRPRLHTFRRCLRRPPTRTATEHRAQAEAYALDHDWNGAAQGSMRALVHFQEERGLFSPRPGTHRRREDVPPPHRSGRGPPPRVTDRQHREAPGRAPMTSPCRSRHGIPPLWARSRGVLLAVLLIVVAGIILAVLQQRDENGGLDPSSYDPRGSRALAALLAHDGIRVQPVDTSPLPANRQARTPPCWSPPPTGSPASSRRPCAPPQPRQMRGSCSSPEARPPSPG